MILTVTLNAAIDRTVAVPNFRLGRRHRAVESRTVAGGKGINVARALSLLGRPVIADRLRRRPDRDPGARTAAGRIGADRLHPDRRRDADQPGGDRPDLGRTDRDQRARAGRQPRGGQAALRPDRVPRRRSEDLRPRRLGPAGGRGRPLRAPGRRPLAARRPGRPRRRGRGDAGRRPRRRLDGDPQRARGRGAGRPGVRRQRRPRPGAAGAGAAGGERGGDHPSRRLRRRGRRGQLSGGCWRSTPNRWRRSPRSARATPSSPATSPPATKAALPRTASPTGWPAGRSRPSTSAPAPSTAIRSSACWARSPCTIWRSPPKCRLAYSTPRPGGLTWKSKSAAARRADALTDSTTSRSFLPAGRGIPTTSTSAGPSAPIASNCHSSPRRWTGSSAPTPPCWSTSWAASGCSTWRGSGPASRMPRRGWRRSPPRPSTRRRG